MDATTFLAQLWGPVLLAVGVGIFVSRPYYSKVYRELERSALAVLLFGMVLMVAGTASVLMHNTWNGVAEIVVSFLGWATLVKGAAFIMFPKLVDKAGDRWANLKLFPVAGTLTLVVGAYLMWIGYIL